MCANAALEIVGVSHDALLTFTCIRLSCIHVLLEERGDGIFFFFLGRSGVTSVLKNGEVIYSKH